MINIVFYSILTVNLLFFTIVNLFFWNYQFKKLKKKMHTKFKIFEFPKLRKKIVIYYLITNLIYLFCAITLSFLFEYIANWQKWMEFLYLNLTNFILASFCFIFGAIKIKTIENNLILGETN